jgi:hypothetical protein
MATSGEEIAQIERQSSSYVLMYQNGNHYETFINDIATDYEKFTNVNIRAETVTASVFMDNTWKHEVTLIAVNSSSSLGTYKPSMGKRTLEFNRQRVRATATWFQVLKELSILVDESARECTESGKRTVFNEAWEYLLKLGTGVESHAIWLSILRAYPYPSFLDNPSKFITLADKFLADAQVNMGSSIRPEN